MDPNNPAENWKSKYYECLDNVDKVEQQHQQETDILKDCVAKACIAAQGQDKALDSRLQSIREILRNPRGSKIIELSSQMRALENQLVAFDDRRTQRLRKLSTSLTAMIHQLQALQPSRSTARKLRDLNKQIQDSTGSGDVDTENWLDRLADLQNSVLAVTNNTANGNDKKAGLIERLLSGRDGNGGSVANTPEDDADIEPVENVGQECARILKELVAQINVPEELSGRLENVIHRLRKEISGAELISVLHEINTLVLAALDKYQVEFEGFLKNLDQRLIAVQTFLDQTQELQLGIFSDGDQLDQKIRDQVSGISDSVDNANDLQELKVSIKDNLLAIIESMTEFKVSQRRKEEALTEQLKTLTERIAVMEQESSATREHIEEQRSKMLMDHLTELPNREAYEKRMASEFQRWQRYHNPLTVAVGDIDHFKHINDNYGHSAGDKVLQAISRTLQKRSRKTDFVCRFGGEEFVILLPETNLEQARIAVEQLREAIADANFHFRGERISVTMSFGIAEFGSDDTPKDVFDRSDGALYKAKGSGRNCVCSAR